MTREGAWGIKVKFQNDFKKLCQIFPTPLILYLNLLFAKWSARIINENETQFLVSTYVESFAGRNSLDFYQYLDTDQVSSPSDE